MLAIQAPLPYFVNNSGAALQQGYLYFGEVGQNPETNPVPVFWDAAGTIPAAQPIRTINGHPARNGTPANVYVSGSYSLAIRDYHKRLVVNSRNSADYSLGAFLAAPDGASFIGFQQEGIGAAVRTVLAKLREGKTFADFGAVGVGDETVQIQNALNSGLAIKADPTKTYTVSGTLTVRDYTTLDMQQAKLVMASTSLQTPMFNCKNTRNVTIKNGRFQGAPMTQATAGNFVVGRKYTIVTPGTTNWVAIGAANNAAGTAFTATGAGSGTGVATTLFNNSNSQDICIAADYATNLRVLDNEFEGFAYTAVNVFFWGESIWIERNKVTGPGASVLNPLGGDPANPGLRNCTGFTVLGYGVHLVDNEITEVSQGVILGQQSHDCTIAGNRIWNTRVEHGMYIDAGIKRVSVVRNIVRDTALIGIKFQNYDSIADVPEDITCAGNTISGTGGDGIIVINAGTNTIATLTNVTNAAVAVFTTAGAHGLAVNDVINITGVVGMTSVNAMYYVASTPTATTFTVKVVGVPLDTSDLAKFPAYVSGGSIARPVFSKTFSITGNTLSRIGQDAISLRFIHGVTVGENTIDDVVRAGIFGQYVRTGDINNNTITNTGAYGIYVLSPTDRCAITDNTLVNPGNVGDDNSGLSSGIVVEGDAGAELDNNTVTGAEAVQMGTLTGITQANPGVFTTAAPHGLVPGQVFAITGVTGMVSVNGAQVVFSTPTPTTFTVGTGVPLDTSALPAYAGGGVVTLVKMQYGIYIASGDKRQYSVRKNTVTLARDAGLRCHEDDDRMLGFIGDNTFEASTGTDVIVGLPPMGRGEPFAPYYADSAVPGSGFWVQGTRLKILYPAAGTPAEYVRTTSGTNPADWAPCAPVQTANAYAVTNPVVTRTINVSTATANDCARVLGTLINDLKLSGALK